MSKEDEVIKKLDAIEKEHLADTVNYGYFIAISYKDENQKHRVNLGSNLTKLGMLKLAAMILDKSETM